MEPISESQEFSARRVLENRSLSVSAGIETENNFGFGKLFLFRLSGKGVSLGEQYVFSQALEGIDLSKLIHHRVGHVYPG